MSQPPPDPLFVVQGDMASIHCVSFHIDQNIETLYAATDDGSIHVWDLKTNRKKTVFKSSDNACLFLHFLNGVLITQDKTCLFKVWKISDTEFTCIYSKQLENLSFCKMSIFEDNTDTYIAIPQCESKINVYLFKFTDIELVNCFIYTDKENTKVGDILIIQMMYVKFKLSIFALYENGALILWDLLTRNVIIYNKITDETPMAFDFDSVNLRGVCGTNGKYITFFKLNNELKINDKKLVEITNPGIGCLKIRPDNKILVAGCWDGKLRIFSWKTCKLLAVLECHQETILSLSFSQTRVFSWNTNYLLAAGSSDKKISLWSIYD